MPNAASHLKTPGNPEFILPKFWMIILLACLATYLFDAPVRFILSKAHLESALYFRDIACAAIVATSVLYWVTGKSSAPAIIPIYILGVHFFWGAINLPSIAQPIVSLKVFLTFLAGITAYKTYEQHADKANYFLQICFFITAIGVAANIFIEMPWAGSTFSSAVGDVGVSREWTSGGVKRVAGFTRSSSETAAFLALLCAPLLTIQSMAIWKKLALYIITFGLIIATTTKGGVIAWLIIGIIFPLASRSNGIKIAISTCLILAAIGIATPILIQIYDLKATVNGDFWWLLSSFAERINWMWPNALNNTKEHGSLIFGRGLGGIGFPQHFGEGVLYNAADNVMLYIYVTFGVMGIAYTIKILLNIARNSATIPKAVSRPISIWLLYWFSYGMVGNNIESPFMLFIAGLITGASLQKPPSKPA